MSFERAQMLDVDAVARKVIADQAAGCVAANVAPEFDPMGRRIEQPRDRAGCVGGYPAADFSIRRGADLGRSDGQVRNAIDAIQRSVAEADDRAHDELWGTGDTKAESTPARVGSRNDLVVQVLRVARLRKEEPALEQ